MLLLVLRSVAVYAATAGVCLFLAHRFARPIRRGVVLTIAAAPLLLTGVATFTGAIYAPLDIVYNSHPFLPLSREMGVAAPRASLLTDVVYQEIPWRKAVRAAVKRGELPLWNPAVLAGEPLLAVQQPAVFHPGTWIGFLLPLAQAWTFEMSLRLLLGLLCAYLFFRELGCRDIPALLGATGWAFSNYFVFFLGYPLSPAVAPFPLLLLGLRRLANGGRSAVGLIVVALMLTLTSGHPESVLHTVAAAGLYFLFELRRSAHAKRAVLQALGAGALALGLSAILLLPLAEALPYTMEHAFRSTVYAHMDRSLPWREVLGRLALEASPLAMKAGLFPQRISAPFGPSGYAGSLLWPLAATGLFGRCRSRLFFLGLGLLGLAVGLSTPAATWLARLPLFDIAINDRLIFLAAFSLCALAALGANRLFEGEGAPVFFAASLASALGLILLFTRYRPGMPSLGISPDEARERFLIQIVPVVGGAVVFAGLSLAHRARAGVILLLLALLAQRRLETAELYATVGSKAFYPPLSVLEKIPRAEPYRFASLAYSFIPNAAALYGLEDVRGYEAMTFLPLRETFPMWCTQQPVWYNRVDDATRPFLAFLNVRWVLVPPGMISPPGWPVLAEGEQMRLVENPRVVPRAFVPRRVLAEPDGARRLAALASVSDFSEDGVVSEDGPSGWTPNGEATVAIVGYGADRLVLEIDARQPALVATSLTAWPGWRARIDDRPLAPVPYNHAFLAYRVPAGRHRLSIHYLPRSVQTGAAVSLAFLVLTGVLAARSGRGAAIPATGTAAPTRLPA